MERRGQQKPNLAHSTRTAFNSGIYGQSERISEQLEFLSSWQTKISRRAQDKHALFSNLMKHINKDTLHEAFKALDGSKALGVDQVSKAMTELWMLIDPTETEFEEPRAGNLHAGICEGVVFFVRKGRG